MTSVLTMQMFLLSLRLQLEAVIIIILMMGHLGILTLGTKLVSR